MITFKDIWDRFIEILPQIPVSEEVMTAKFDAMAEDYKMNGGLDLNWRESVSDFLVLIDIDASAANRDALSAELGVTVGKSGDADRNEALRVALWNKIKENGGEIPASLRD